MEKMIVIGIDPGITGGICVLDPEDRIASLVDMPVNERIVPNRRNNKRAKSLTRKERQLDSIKLGAHFVRIVDYIMTRKDTGYAVFLERVGGFQGQSAHLSFVFGSHVGQILGALGVLKIKPEMVSPSEWTKTMVPGRKSKSDHVKAARGFLLDLGMADQVSDGRADALLIAKYGRRILDARERAKQGP